MTDGPLYVFYDPAQQIFRTDTQWMPALAAPFTLATNCRNTEAIAKRCGEVIGKEIKVLAGTPMGREPQIVVARTPESQLKALEKQVKDWCAAGLKAHQIAVVAAKKLEASCCAVLSQIGGIPVTDKLDDWRAGRGLLRSTLGKFKGLEADAMVLVDVPEVDDLGFRKEHRYVAYSRARHLLTVLVR
jgi:hypothetical protein